MMFSFLLVALASMLALSQTAGPFIGTWKLNVEKSKFESGSPPKSATMTFEDRGGGVLLWTYEGIDAEGNRGFQQFAAKYDGRDYPFLGLAVKAPVSISLNLVDAYSDEAVLKADGKVFSNASSTISTDGKTLTHTLKSTDDQGQQVTTAIQVYDRQ